MTPRTDALPHSMTWCQECTEFMWQCGCHYMAAANLCRELETENQQLKREIEKLKQSIEKS